jgi:hypothetical protein
MNQSTRVLGYAKVRISTQFCTIVCTPYALTRTTEPRTRKSGKTGPFWRGFCAQRVKGHETDLEHLNNSIAIRFALRATVFLPFGCVFARFGFPSPASQVPIRDVRFAQSSQGTAAMLPRSSVGFPSLASQFPRERTCRFAASNAKSQKSSPRTAAQFLERLSSRKQ